MGASCCRPAAVVGQNTLAAELHHAQPRALLFSSPHGVFPMFPLFRSLGWIQVPTRTPASAPHCIPMGAAASIPRSPPNQCQPGFPAQCRSHTGVHGAHSRTPLLCSTALHPQPLTRSYRQRFHTACLPNCLPDLFSNLSCLNTNNYSRVTD